MSGPTADNPLTVCSAKGCPGKSNKHSNPPPPLLQLHTGRGGKTSSLNYHSCSHVEEELLCRYSSESPWQRLQLEESFPLGTQPQHGSSTWRCAASAGPVGKDGRSA